MTTDSERREVARRLRGLHLNPWDDAACEIAQCAGIACCNSECHGSNETPECTMALCAHLADLIDPDCGTQEADSSPVPEHNADLSKMVDRDALLRLARYMDKDVAETEAHFSNVISTKSVSDYARRIREALGVSNG